MVFIFIRFTPGYTRFPFYTRFLTPPKLEKLSSKLFFSATVPSQWTCSVESVGSDDCSKPGSVAKNYDFILIELILGVAVIATFPGRFLTVLSQARLGLLVTNL
jgi:hypothetical protein